MTTHDTHIQYKLRMPPELRDQLKAASEENHRSMNAEIVARLQESLDQPHPNTNAFHNEIKERLFAEFMERLNRELPWSKDKSGTDSQKDEE